MDNAQQQKLHTLGAVLKGMEKPVIAVSGGLDSRFLAHTMQRLGIAFTAVHITGPHVTPAETQEARDWMRSRFMEYRIINIDPLSDNAVSANNDDRCYHCKRIIFSAVLETADSRTVCDGSNASDLLTYRPGRRALTELGICSPLADAKITKDDIRAIGKATGLDRPDQTARPCLLTRFAYGVRPDKPLLEKLGACEDALRRTGLEGFRLRVPKADTPLLQVPATEQAFAQSRMEEITKILHEHGFSGCPVRFDEQVSGWYDNDRKNA